MGWSSEAIIAMVGVLVNVPTFCLVLWRICRKKVTNRNPARFSEDGGSDASLLAPRRSTWEPEYALALPYAVPLINMTPRPTTN